METGKPSLFIEINKTNYIFVAATYDDKQNFKIVEKIIIPNNDLNEKTFSNLNQLEKIIKENLRIIEDKLNHIFKEINLILDDFNYSCINISGFKKLNGSQLLKENISYILNSLKLNIMENEKKKTILNIFNSKSILDGNTLENLPIGLFGDFYIHELTFLLIENNDFKNIKQIFSKNHLKVKKIFVKDFIEGIQLIDFDKNIENFFKIKISQKNSKIFFFEKGSLRYSEQFNFGTNIIIKDISKICSIKSELIEKMLLKNIFINEKYEDDELIEEKYFVEGNFRKIRKKLIKDIASARIEEIIKIIFNQNINSEILKKNSGKIYTFVEDKFIFNNFKKSFKNYLSLNNNFESQFINEFELDQTILNATNLSNYGWIKEAVPITQSKNTLITRIFKSLFG